MIDKDGSFLGVENSAASSEHHFCLIPFGLEKTVTFGAGTAFGPEKIIEASQQVELFDMEFEAEVCHEYNFETLLPEPIAASLDDALSQIEGLAEKALNENKIPIILGGEHSLTPGALRPFAHRFEQLTVVQFDAHCDLRDGYLGDNYSHASAMRRCLDFPNVDVIMIGIRNVSQEEHQFVKTSNRVKMFTAFEPDWTQVAATIAQLVQDKNVYISIDVDAFDPSIMPATGTPEPGGLSWGNVLELLRSVTQVANVRGADIVEHSPIDGFHASDFLVAQLGYKLMSYIYRNAQRDQ